MLIKKIKDFFSLKLHLLNKTKLPKKLIVLEKDIFKHLPERMWISAYKKYMRSNIGTYLINGQMITVNKRTIGETIYSDYSRWLFKKAPDIYYDKLRILTDPEKLIQNSFGWINESNNHIRKDDIVQFSRGYINYLIGKNVYKADVIVVLKKNSEDVLYDVVNINKIKG